MSDDALFDEHAHDYDATVQQAIGPSGESVQYFAELKVRMMAQALSADQPRTILDFGCGIGNTTRTLARQFPRAVVTGFDVSAESIAVARQMTPPSAGAISYVYATGDILPFDNQAFDAAFTSCVFHHIEPANRLQWVRELNRVLSPGSPLFLFEHNPWNPLTVRVVRNVPFDEGIVPLKPAYTTHLLRAAGFTTSPPWFYFFFPRILRWLRPLERWLRRFPMGAQYYVAGRSRAS